MSVPRLLRWLTLIALFLAPIAMIGGTPAMAGHGLAASSHCHESGTPAEAPPAAPIDCMIACAGLPAQSSSVDLRAPIPALPEPAAAQSHLPGLQPEAATPPPRAS